MKVAKEIAEEIMQSYSTGEQIGELTVVNIGKWRDEGKYQHKTNIVGDNDGNLYSLSDSRSGSYHSDYHYNSEWAWGAEVELTPVKAVEKTITVYEAVK